MDVVRNFKLFWIYIVTFPKELEYTYDYVNLKEAKL